VRTDSFDGDGTVTAVSDASGVSWPMIERELDALRGVLEQVPPMWSAVKVDGRRLYEHARRGEVVERAPRSVTIFRLDIVDWEPPTVTLFVDCSKGTYVRSLASELGERLGTGAYLSNLVRVRTGPFSICDAITLDDLTRAELPWSWPEISQHPDAVIADWPALLLGDAGSQAWVNGVGMEARRSASGACRVYDERGHWLGLGRAAHEGRLWQPLKVVARAA
jgi:tRNA pseudouridine55 synthase